VNQKTKQKSKQTRQIRKKNELFTLFFVYRVL
jgi:hypothetical protein